MTKAEKKVRNALQNLNKAFEGLYKEQGMKYCGLYICQEGERKMTITSYFGLKPCCDCGRTGNYTVNKSGYQFTVCSDCIHNYSDEEEEENDRRK